VAVRDGRILAVGSRRKVAQHAGPDTRRLDLSTGMVLPGFQDAHVHPDGGGLVKSRCDLHGISGREGYAQAIRRYADDHPTVGWILGGGWSLPDFPGGTPHRSDLDSLVPRPARLPEESRRPRSLGEQPCAGVGGHHASHAGSSRWKDRARCGWDALRDVARRCHGPRRPTGPRADPGRVGTGLASGPGVPPFPWGHGVAGRPRDGRDADRLPGSRRARRPHRARRGRPVVGTGSRRGAGREVARAQGARSGRTPSKPRR
jgi:hypothetical protein